jgi:thiamine biosynthesis lipoprotein
MVPLAIPPLAIEAQDIEVLPTASAESQLWRFQDEYVLGTRLEVLVNSNSAVLANTAARVAREEIDRLNLVFNHRRSDSELSGLNVARHALASADLFAVLQLSETWRQITRGAFDGRMGALLQLWISATVPNVQTIEHALAALRGSKVVLDPTDRRVELSSDTELSLDAIAKGYIVDAALSAVRRASLGIAGLAIGIGGDIRCFGETPDPCGWRIGIPDPTKLAENAPLVDAVALNNAAIATSGRGPRDYIGNRFRSTTISPFSGRPVYEIISASVVASHAADADAIATACLVLPPAESLALVDRLDGVAARITDARGEVHESPGWSTMRIAAAVPKKTAPEKQSASVNSSISNKGPSLPPEQRWPSDWELGIHYTAPEQRKDERSSDFRTPYLAVWITDTQNRPVRTVLMVGTAAEWQRDNFIWWGMHRARAAELVDLRSQATTLSGRYPAYWPGVDDNWQPVPIGKYVLHLETSQERGKHYYRSINIELGRERFKTKLPSLPESGGVDISYGHYNDRFNSDE